MRRSLQLSLALAALLLALPSPAPAADAATGVAPATPARAAFERFQALAGEWRGKSTKGWTDRSEFQVVGGGAAVLSTSRFDGDDPSPMATVFVLEGDRLFLTHYCEAGNQPQMEATEISPDGRHVTFTFAGGTNLPSRDAGHMDKAVYQFRDADHYSTQWTWYKDGQERWLEEIEMARSRD